MNQWSCTILQRSVLCTKYALKSYVSNLKRSVLNCGGKCSPREKCEQKWWLPDFKSTSGYFWPSQASRKSVIVKPRAHNWISAGVHSEWLCYESWYWVLPMHNWTRIRNRNDWKIRWKLYYLTHFNCCRQVEEMCFAMKSYKLFKNITSTFGSCNCAHIHKRC